jgi:hypothetical protein
MYGIDLASMTSRATYVELAKTQVVRQRRLDDLIEGHDAEVVMINSAVGEGTLTREQADLILESYESQVRTLTAFVERFKETFGLD